MRGFAISLLFCGLMAGPAVLASGSNDKTPAGTSDTTAKNTAQPANSTQPPAAKAAPANAPATPAAATPALEAELQQLRDLMESQQAMLKSQQAQIEALKSQLNGVHPSIAAGTPSGTATASGAPAPSAAPTGNATVAAQYGASADDQNKSPLSFKIGSADFTPGGFLDFTSFTRSTNVGSGIGTSFNSIPFNNAANGSGNQSESRFSAQNSRVTLKVEAPIKGGVMTGYVEADFLGNAPSNLNVTSNSNTLRMRVYFADYRRGNWEILGGQDWSMMTPSRKGIGYMPADEFYTQDMDTNYQVGLTWARQAQFRLVYHPTKNWALGVSLENPDQYTGSAVAFPAQFAPSAGTSLTNQVDTGAGTNSPGFFPDIIAKVAHDHDINGKNLHFEVAGVLSGFRLSTPGTITASSSANQSKIGGGVAFNTNLELFKNFHFVTNTFWSDGDGRYIFGLGPNFVVGQDAASLNFFPVLVHAGSAVGGFEWQATKKSMFYGYYGAAYFTNETLVDPTTGKLIGYGFTGSASSNNRAIQEGTLGVIQTIWKNPSYGALQIITQASYLTRAPWWVLAPTDAVPGAPKNAHLAMAYVDLRYVLP